VAVYYKSVNCDPLTPLLRFVVDLLYNVFLQLTIFQLTARRAVRLRPFVGAADRGCADQNACLGLGLRHYEACLRHYAARNLQYADS